jgi:hypothetical protein
VVVVLGKVLYGRMNLRRRRGGAWASLRQILRYLLPQLNCPGVLFRNRICVPSLVPIYLPFRYMYCFFNSNNDTRKSIQREMLTGSWKPHRSVCLMFVKHRLFPISRRLFYGKQRQTEQR